MAQNCVLPHSTYYNHKVYHKISTGCKLHNSDSDVLGEIIVLQKIFYLKLFFLSTNQ